MFHQTENDRLNALLDEDPMDTADDKEILDDVDDGDDAEEDLHTADLDGMQLGPRTEIDGAEG